MIEAYRPSNSITPTGLFMLALASVVANYFWFIIVFPVIFGFLGGGLLVEVIKGRNIHQKTLLTIAGVAMGVMIFATMKYGEYLVFYAEFRDFLQNEYNIADTGAQARLIDEWLVQETNFSGLPGYMVVKSTVGVSIGKFYDADQFTLSPLLTWIYWLAEIIMMSTVAVFCARSAASQPFCAACRRPYNGGVRIGELNEVAGQQFLTELAAGQFRAAGALLHQSVVSSPGYDVYVQSCLQPDRHPSLFAVQYVRDDHQGKLLSTNVLEGLIPADALRTIRNAADGEIDLI
jgi:hypothetical protein